MDGAKTHKRNARGRERSPLKRAVTPTATTTPTEASQKKSKEEKRKTAVPPILESDRHWKTLHVWIVKNDVDYRLKEVRDGGLHINMKDAQGNCKLKNDLQEKGIRYLTHSIKKTNLRVVVKGFPISSDLEDIFNDLYAQGIGVDSIYRM